ncbi:hypothetical protein [Xanthomonas hortorum]|uniref:hypothetical protein n=1 Tax=Xanthomonas hortorum TaxID=56454 RepID=UPI0039830F78
MASKNGFKEWLQRMASKNGFKKALQITHTPAVGQRSTFLQTGRYPTYPGHNPFTGYPP